jgi:hypothetical protein
MAVDDTQLAGIHRLLRGDASSVLQGLELLRALDDVDVWGRLAEGVVLDADNAISVPRESEVAMRVWYSDESGYRALVALWALRCTGRLAGVSRLKLRGLPLTDLTPLEGLDALEELVVADCPNLVSIEGLAGASGLRTLTLIGCRALVDVLVQRDWTDLCHMASLRELGLYQTGIQDWAFLGRLPNLTALAVDEVPDLRLLAPCKRLEAVRADRATNTSALLGLPELRKVRARNSDIDVPTVAALLAREGLVSLDVSGPDAPKVLELVEPTAIAAQRSFLAMLAPARSAPSPDAPATTLSRAEIKVEKARLNAAFKAANDPEQAVAAMLGTPLDVLYAVGMKASVGADGRLDGACGAKVTHASDVLLAFADRAGLLDGIQVLDLSEWKHSSLGALKRHADTLRYLFTCDKLDHRTWWSATPSEAETWSCFCPRCSRHSPVQRTQSLRARLDEAPALPAPASPSELFVAARTEKARRAFRVELSRSKYWQTPLEDMAPLLTSPTPDEDATNFSLALHQELDKRVGVFVGDHSECLGWRTDETSLHVLARFYSRGCHHGIYLFTRDRSVRYVGVALHEPMQVRLFSHFDPSAGGYLASMVKRGEVADFGAAVDCVKREQERVVVLSFGILTDDLARRMVVKVANRLRVLLTEAVNRPTGLPESVDAALDALPAWEAAHLDALVAPPAASGVRAASLAVEESALLG